MIKPQKFTIRQHRPGMGYPVDIHTRKIAYERAERLASKFATDLGIKVEVVRALTGEVLSTFGA